MKIVELLLVPETKECLHALVDRLDCDAGSVMDIDVYRLDIDDELAVMMFNLLPEESVPDELVEHLALHATGTLVITEGDIAEIDAEKARRIENICEVVADKPIVVAMQAKLESLQKIRKVVFEDGIFLNDKGRAMMWSKTSHESQVRIWRNLFKLIGIDSN
ncbi:MAG: hypothetical protein ACRBF0_06640 [Calditrichia bacterium]